MRSLLFIVVVIMTTASQSFAGGFPRVVAPNDIEKIAMSPDGRWFALTTSQGEASIYDMKSKKAKARKLTGFVRHLSFAGNQHLVAEVGADSSERSIVAWHVDTLAKAYTSSPSLTAKETLSQDALLIAGHPRDPVFVWSKKSASAGVYVVDIPSKKKESKPSIVATNGIAFSQDGKHFIAGTSIRSWRGTMNRGANSKVVAVGLSPSGKRIAEFWNDDRLTLIDVDTNKVIETIETVKLSDAWESCYESGVHFIDDENLLYYCTGVDAYSVDLALVRWRVGKKPKARAVSGKELGVLPLINTATKVGAWADGKRVRFQRAKR